MRTKELILECMVKAKTPSMYQLAKLWEMHSGLISDYMNGKRKPDEYACFRIAETLGRDPATIIAEINADVTGKHRAYFRDFLQRRGMLVLLVGLSLSSYSDSYAAGANAATLEPAHNVYYVKSYAKETWVALSIMPPTI